MTIKEIIEAYWEHIKGAAEKYDIPPEIIVGIIKQESNGIPTARSSCGAYGLTQIMPATAMERKYDLLSTKGQIYGCADYLRWLLNHYAKSNEDMIAGYNAGPARIKGSMWKLIKETSLYVPRVIKYSLKAKEYIYEKLIKEAVTEEIPEVIKEKIVGRVIVKSRTKRGNKYRRDYD